MAACTRSDVWDDPPWRGAPVKHRLGLAPISLSAWLVEDSRLAAHKAFMLEHEYARVVATAPGHAHPDMSGWRLPLTRPVEARYPDPVANLAAAIDEDVCLLDVTDHQRLIAACVCAPSYWSLTDKIGRPLRDVHAPVHGMNERIGANVTRFIDNLPVDVPFARSNWFVHGDDDLFHDHDESMAAFGDAAGQWHVRVERQVLYKPEPRYVLFTIRVVFEPLVAMWQHADAAADLVRAVERMDPHEIEHFGAARHARLRRYLSK